MDLIKLTVTEDGNQYIRLMVDYSQSGQRPTLWRTNLQWTWPIVFLIFVLVQLRDCLQIRGKRTKRWVKKTQKFRNIYFLLSWTANSDLFSVKGNLRVIWDSVKLWEFREASVLHTTLKQMAWLRGLMASSRGKLHIIKFVDLYQVSLNAID